MDKLIKIQACAVGLLLLQACGFEPLHMRHKESPAGHTMIEGLSIDRIPDREGQILRNYLIDFLDPVHQGAPAHPRQFLEVTLKKTKATMAIRKDGTTSRYQIILNGDVTLWDQDRKKRLITEKVRAVNSYSVGEISAGAAYSTNISEKDATHKALRLMAEEIQMLLKTHPHVTGIR